jgi:hypothetical protein
VLIVDRTPPKVEGLTVSPVATPSTPAVINFSMTDDYSDSLSYHIEVLSQIPGASPVYVSEPVTGGQGSVSTSWTPRLTDAGPMEIRVVIVDASGNAGSSSAGTVGV